MIFITGASVLTPSGIERASVLIDGDIIVSVGDIGAGNGSKVIDARGAWVGPGLVDLHVHFRDPGETWKEDLETGARSAAAGGYTAVVTMPNTDPPIDDGRRAREAISRASGIGTVHVGVAGALTRDRAGRQMSDLDGMYEAGIRMFTDDGDAVPETGLLRSIMSYLIDLPGAFVAEHPEDRSVTLDGHINEGPMSVMHGVVGLPGIAEDVIVSRDISIARDTGGRLHIQHVSTQSSVEHIRQARLAGVKVSSEVTPHHLALDETALAELDPNLKMYPPLRSAGDREAVTTGLRQGVIDAVATDHAPHTVAEKAVPFEEAPRGVIGLETAAAVASGALGRDQAVFFDRMSTAPARIAGLARHGMAVEPGAPANLVVYDPERAWIPGAFASKSANSPFTGMELTGRVLATIHEGRISYEGSQG
ncbi:MAG: dihydroorotase [Acidimicrobiia bacterium]